MCHTGLWQYCDDNDNDWLIISSSNVDNDSRDCDDDNYGDINNNYIIINNSDDDNVIDIN